MKKLTKLLGIVVILALVMSISVSAFAEDPITETITLSVNPLNANSAEGGQPDQNNTAEDYVAFKIFDATKNLRTVGDTDDNTIENQSATTAAEGISYFLSFESPWAGIVSNTTITPYLTFTEAADRSGWTVAWNLLDEENSSGKEYNEANAKLLAKALSDLIVEVTDSAGIVTDYKVGEKALAVNSDYYAVGASGTDVPVGYYLIKSSLGSNLVLATTDIKITEKNEYPTEEKTITGTSDDTAALDNLETDAQIGDTVKFELTANIPDEANKDVYLHDTMSLGLSLNLARESGIFTVKLDGTAVPQSVDTRTNWYIQYSSDPTKLATTGSGNQTGVTATTFGANGSDLKDNDSFVVVFTEDYIKNLTRTSETTQFTFTVEYEAVLNDAAVLASSEDVSNYNSNKVQLDYSNYSTPDYEVKVYTHEFDLIKYYQDKTADPATKKILKDAEFKLYRDTQVGENGKLKSDAEPIKFVKTDDVYRVWDGFYVVPQGSTTTDTLTSATGQYNIEGLDVGFYYLEETKAPDGYNKLANMIKIEIKAVNSGDTTATVHTEVAANTGVTTGSNGTIEYTMGVAGTAAATVNGDTYASGGVAVENNSGTVLPSTGGIGTTIFYVVGSVLVIAAGVLLVTKKRMGRD